MTMMRPLTITTESLDADTYPSFEKALAIARVRVQETNHNTGFSKVIKNCLRVQGDSGVVAIVKKTGRGHARMTYLREHARISGPAAMRPSRSRAT